MESNANKTTTSKLAMHASGVSITQAGAPMKSRIMGVDAARGLALLGMVAVHVFPDFNNGTASMVHMVVAGKAVALFVLLAGVSLAFITGSRPTEGKTRTAVAASLAVRALLIGLIGLTLGYTGSPVDVILVCYSVLFLLVIPLISLRPGLLACLAFVIALVVPVFTLLIGDSLRGVVLDSNPTFHSFLQPDRFAVGLLFTGPYPALVYMAYICAGLAIGRLKLSSVRVAIRLLGSGLALALCTWVTSSVLLFHMSGLQHLREAALPGTPSDQLTDNVLLWSPAHIISWW